MSTEQDEREAAERAGLDYDAICLASMIADYMRGKKPELHQLPFTARWLVICYLAQHDGTTGFARDSATGRMIDRVPRVQRRDARELPAGDIIDAEILEDES